MILIYINWYITVHQIFQGGVRMKVRIKTTCTNCQSPGECIVDLEPIQLAPVTRCNIPPVANVFEYRITSDQIERFLIDKAREFKIDVKIKVAPRYTESKRRKKGDHGAYASLRIAFSEGVIERGADNGWFGKIGDNGNIRVIPSIFKEFINKYKYDRDDLKKIKNNYKLLEELEEGLGINESYLENLIEFANPRVINSTNDEPWVFIAAAAEKVIADMLTVAETNQMPGRIEIRDVVQISKESVMYIVNVHPGREVKEDPSVRRILLGEEKVKN